MRAINRIKLIMVIFALSQFLFSSFYELFAGSADLYPAYTWKIFHTQPDRYVTHHEIYLHQVDKQIFSPPLEGLAAIEKHFPHIKNYEFNRKIQYYGKGKRRRQNIISDFDQLFTKNNKFVSWEIREKKFNPIDYYWEKKILYEKSLGQHESTK